MSGPQVYVAADLAELSRKAAAAFVDAANTAIEARGRFSVALAGGSTPRPVYERLAGEGGTLDWSAVHVFWGDERWVPRSDPASNFRMAHEALLGRAPIPAENVHAVDTSLASPEASAQEYETRLRRWLDARADAPSFDLVLLGLGEDGHTASLFPGDPVLDETERWVRHVKAPASYPVRDRITLTPPVLIRAREIMFLAAGAAKCDVISQILEGNGSLMMPPARLVRLADKVIWFCDCGAITATGNRRTGPE